MSVLVKGKQGPKGERGERPIAKIFKITVANGEYYINGVSKRTLKLIEGQKYIFDQTDPSNENHPLKLSTMIDGNHPTKGAELTLSDGWSYQDSRGVYEVPNNMQVSTLYYYCDNHANMGGSIGIFDLETGIKGEKGDRGERGERSIANIFKITVSNGVYNINGVPKKELKLIEGQKYIFDQTHISNANHPLRLSKQPDGNHPTKGVDLTLSDGWSYENGKGIYEVPNNILESAVYYYCDNHANMGGTMNIYDLETRFKSESTITKYFHIDYNSIEGRYSIDGSFNTITLHRGFTYRFKKSPQMNTTIWQNFKIDISHNRTNTDMLKVTYQPESKPEFDVYIHPYAKPDTLFNYIYGTNVSKVPNGISIIIRDIEKSLSEIPELKSKIAFLENEIQTIKSQMNPNP